jgi:uncharacterized protein YdhG (YjbR/CyaY superfamily)
MKNSIIQDYIQAQSQQIQLILKALYQAIQEAAPDATEKMSYGMPTFYLNGNLVHFAAYKNHIGFYPAPSGITNFIDELKPFKTSKGAIQFPIDKPLPIELIQKITAFRVKENLNKSK